MILDRDRGYPAAESLVSLALFGRHAMAGGRLGHQAPPKQQYFTHMPAKVRLDRNQLGG
jgi:hypothetical protein